MKSRYIFLSFWILCVLCMLFLARELKLSHDFFENYTAKNYTEAQKDIERKYWNTAIDFHNLGNTQYFLSQENETQKKSLLEAALKSYEASLKRREHPETRSNYEYVQKLLENILEETSQEQTSDESQSSDSQSKQQEENQASSASWTTWENQKQETENAEQDQKNAPIQNARGEEYKLSDEDALSELTDEEKQALEAYIEKLHDEQAENQGLFGKQVPEKNDFEKRFESLFGGSEEKDW